MKNEKIKLIADLHIHTVASGHAYSTMEEYVAAAKKKKLKIIAFTDHGPAMPGGAPLYHFANQKMIPDTLQGIRILRGAEVNVINFDGELDIPDEKGMGWQAMTDRVADRVQFAHQAGRFHKCAVSGAASSISRTLRARIPGV